MAEPSGRQLSVPLAMRLNALPLGCSHELPESATAAGSAPS
jgi:hypothetical protein